MEKNNHSHRKQFVSGAFKFLIATGSIAGTLGIWNVLAKQDVEVNAQGVDLTSLNQAPLPTLVPLTSVKMEPTSIVVEPTPIREVNTPVNSNPNPGIVPPNNQSSPVVIPAPLTTTRSSR